jgi:hypothetical protein
VGEAEPELCAEVGLSERECVRGPTGTRSEAPSYRLKSDSTEMCGLRGRVTELPKVKGRFNCLHTVFVGVTVAVAL